MDPQLITVSAQPFSEMFDTTKTVLAVCMRFFCTHKERLSVMALNWLT